MIAHQRKSFPSRLGQKEWRGRRRHVKLNGPRDIQELRTDCARATGSGTLVCTALLCRGEKERDRERGEGALRLGNTMTTNIDNSS